MNNNPNENGIQQGGNSVTSENVVNNAATPLVVSTPVPTQPSVVQTSTTTCPQQPTSVVENSTSIFQQQPVQVVETVFPTATIVQSTSSPVITQAPQTAEAIVAQVEQQAAIAAAEVKAAPVAPQQNRIQLVDDKPKLNAVILNNGTAVSMSASASGVSENTEILDVIEEPPIESSDTSSTDKKEKSHTFGLVVLFGGLLLLIIFLPDISYYFEKQFLKDDSNEEEITTGKLVCESKNSDNKFDFFYEYSVDFADERISKITIINETKGDAALDEKELDDLLTECKSLKNFVEDAGGINVSCSLTGGIFTRKQVFELASITDRSVITAYVEAGGTYINYAYNDELDGVKNDLLNMEFECKKEK